MTVIAWDGDSLAADKASENCGMVLRVTKIRKLGSGEVIAWCGKMENGLALARWYADGAEIDHWPSFQRTDDWSRLIVANEEHVFFYEQEPERQFVDEPFCAWGSGRDFAIGAMAMGANAAKAIEIASKYNIFCGLGCDSIRVRKKEKNQVLRLVE